MAAQAQTRPVRENTFHETAAGPLLVASRNTATGELQFPPLAAPGWDGTQLPRTGKLFTYSTVHMPSANFAPGYTVGYVKFTDNTGAAVLAFGPLRAPAGHVFTVGEEMTVALETLWQDEEGTGITGFVFAAGEQE